MSFKMVSFLGTLFVGCLGRYVLWANDPNQTAVLADQQIGCIENSEEDFTLNLKFQATAKGYHEFYVVLNNSLIESTAEFHNDSKYPTSFVFRDNLWTNIGLAARRSKTLTMVVPRKMINPKGNRFSVYNRELDSGFNVKGTYMVGFRLDVQDRRTWDLTVDGDLFRDGDAYTGATIEDGRIYQKPYTVKHNNFITEYKNPNKNRLPLNNLEIGVTNYKQELEAPSYGYAYLKVSNYLDDFNIFTLNSNGYTSWREIPVEIVESKENEMWTFELRDTYAVTMDGRTMKLVENKNENDLYTKDLYLPPVSAGEAKVFMFELIVADTGPNGLDKWVYAFEVTKTENYIGSCISSTYCVGRE